jgi:hypothetical protein
MGDINMCSREWSKAITKKQLKEIKTKQHSLKTKPKSKHVYLNKLRA